MATKQKPKTKKPKIKKVKIKIDLPKIKLNANAKIVFAEIQNDVQKRIVKNAKIESKRNYSSPNAIYFWAKMALALTQKPIAKELRVSTKGNALARRDWCAKNNAVMVDRSLVIETKEIKKDRPDNAIRIRLSRLTHGKNLGYVRVISNKEYVKNPNHELAEMVYIYKK